VKRRVLKRENGIPKFGGAEERRGNGSERQDEFHAYMEQHETGRFPGKNMLPVYVAWQLCLERTWE